MFTITIHEEAETPEDLATMLRYIASLLEEGYTSGRGPSWSLEDDEVARVRREKTRIVRMIEMHPDGHVSTSSSKEKAQP